MRKIVIVLIRAYQLAISPYLGMHCRFSPSCSHYAIAAFEKHGTFKGFWYSIKRIARCHPWQAGGHDPVP